MKAAPLVIFLLLTIGHVLSANADSRTVNFQSCLLDTNGASVQDDVYALRLWLYADSTGGAPLWESNGLVSVETKGGCFRHLLGTTNQLPDSVFRYQSLWVGVSVGYGSEIIPRTLVVLPKSSEIVKPQMVPITQVPATPSQPKKKKGRIPLLYAHFSASCGFGFMGMGDEYKSLVTPFEPSAGFGYNVGICVGFRNIYQLEYRARTVASIDLKASEANVTIPMDFHLRNEFIHKLNLFGLQKVKGDIASCLFICYGTAESGTARHVDENGDGFWDGSSHMIGTELGILSKLAEATIVLERHSVTFKHFGITGLGTLEGDIDASFWYFGFRVGFGTGIIL